MCDDGTNQNAMHGRLHGYRDNGDGTVTVQFKNNVSTIGVIQKWHSGSCCAQFEEGERVVGMAVISEYKENAHILFAFENGKAVRIPVVSYQTKTNRRKLTGAYSDASPLVGVLYLEQTEDVLFVDDSQRGLIVKSDLISEKTTRSSGGVQVVTLKKNGKLASVHTHFSAQKGNKLTKIKIPAAPVPFSNGEVAITFEEY